MRELISYELIESKEIIAQFKREHNIHLNGLHRLLALLYPEKKKVDYINAYVAVNPKSIGTDWIFHRTRDDQSNNNCHRTILSV